MKRFLVYTILVILLLVSIGLYPVTKTFDCNPVSEIIKGNMRAGRGLFATAITDQYVVLQFYINPSTRAWSVIAIDATLKNRACTVINGVDWMFPGEVNI